METSMEALRETLDTLDDENLMRRALVISVEMLYRAELEIERLKSRLASEPIVTKGVPG